MPDNFTTELVDSAGEIFATDAIGGSSVHYPIGKLAYFMGGARLTEPPGCPEALARRFRTKCGIGFTR